MVSDKQEQIQRYKVSSCAGEKRSPTACIKPSPQKQYHCFGSPSKREKKEMKRVKEAIMTDNNDNND